MRRAARWVTGRGGGSGRGATIPSRVRDGLGPYRVHELAWWIGQPRAGRWGEEVGSSPPSRRPSRRIAARKGVDQHVQLVDPPPPQQPLPARHQVGDRCGRRRPPGPPGRLACEVGRPRKVCTRVSARRPAWRIAARQACTRMFSSATARYASPDRRNSTTSRITEPAPAPVPTPASPALPSPTAVPIGGPARRRSRRSQRRRPAQAVADGSGSPGRAQPTP